MDTNACTRYFCELLRNIVDMHAPIKTKNIRHNNVPYMNSEQRKWQYKRNMLRNVKNKHPNKQNDDLYRKARNKCASLRTQSQRKYFEERCDGGTKNQYFWPTIKPFLSNKFSSNKDVMLFENDRFITDTKQVADVFNRYFTEIAQGIGFNDDPILHDYYEKSTMATLISKCDFHLSIIAIKRNISSGQNVALFEIYHMLIKMDGKKATGFDEISSKYLKIGATPLAGPISRLINLSILECKFPDILKYAEVNALFKRIDELIKENYRPVSILTAISKIFERVFNI